MAEIVVREAIGEEDVTAVRMLLEKYGEYLAANPHGAHICIGSYAEELAGLPKPYAALLLALVDGKAAGCVALKPVSKSAVEERACEMKRLWVGGEFRGLGLGRRLVEEAIAWAKRTGHGGDISGYRSGSFSRGQPDLQCHGICAGKAL